MGNSRCGTGPVWIMAVFISLNLAACSDKRSEPPGWQVPPDEALRANPVPYYEGSIVQGRALFEQHCLACHGYYGDGNGLVGPVLDQKPANLLRIAGSETAGSFAWKISQGRGEMPAFRDKLSENDIWNITNFVMSLEKQQTSR